MRARNIKPGLYKNDYLAECSIYARWLFTGLWCMADREGRMEDRPNRIKVEIVPYDDIDVNSLLDELERHGFIYRYSVGGYRYIEVINFLKHQKPHPNESKSVIPGPEEVVSTSNQGSKGLDHTMDSSTKPLTQEKVVNTSNQGSKGLEHSKDQDVVSETKDESTSGAIENPYPDKGNTQTYNQGSKDLPPRSEASNTNSISARADIRNEDIRNEDIRNEEFVSGEPTHTPEQPWDVYAAYCEEMGHDPSESSPSFQGKQLKLAQKLLEEGFGVDKVRRCIRYLKTQEWVDMIDLGIVHSQIGKWEVNGEPTGSKPKNGKSQNGNGGYYAKYERTSYIPNPDDPEGPDIKKPGIEPWKPKGKQKERLLREAQQDDEDGRLARYQLDKYGIEYEYTPPAERKVTYDDL